MSYFLLHTRAARRSLVRVCLTAAAAAGGLVAADARAAVVPTFAFAQGSASHSSGGPGETPAGIGLPVRSGAAVLDQTNRIDFPSGSGSGNTIMRAGLGRSQSTNRAQVTFAKGTGISQSDPGHTRGPSSLTINFQSRWTIPSGSLGPPITAGFSVPVGLNIGSGGSATFAAEVYWDANVGLSPIPNARAPYIVSQTFGPGKYLRSFTAPAAPFSPPAIADTFGYPGEVTIRGVLRFTVDNDDAPSLIELPTAENFGDLPDFEQFNYEPGAVVEAPVPEPSAACGLLAAGVLCGSRRRRRRR